MPKDYFRPAEKWTRCPECGEYFGWNTEDGLKGQTCPCGHTFTGRERNPDTRDLRARRRSAMLRRAAR